MFPWLLSLPSRITTRRGADGVLQLLSASGAWKLPGISPEVENALIHGATRERLESWVAAKELASLLYTLTQLDTLGLLCRSVAGEDGLLATWQPLVEGTAFQESPPLGDISRFAFLRRRKGRSVLENPLNSSRVVLWDWRATALFGAYPENPELLPDHQTQALLCLFANCGLTDADQDPPLWDFHSLLFHSRSRIGRSLGPHGVGARAWEEPERPHPPTLSLPRPHKAELSGTDPSFFEVLERRRSRREQGAIPISFQQLGEFLWRTAREESGRRPYPCAGGVYELEISVIVHRCLGLEPGIYRYHPKAHGLESVASAGGTLLIEDAQQACWGDKPPQVLLLLSARFARMSSKYRNIAYSNILKDVGVVMQTMCLSASAMNLAACPIGTGDSDLFCRLLGTEYGQESSVGELILGTPPDELKES